MYKLDISDVQNPTLGSKLSWDHRFKQAVKFLGKVADEGIHLLNYVAKFSTESGDLSIDILLN